jgi:bifunctional non-homologous end joining protein LigD
MARARLSTLQSPPSWIRPQLAQLVTEAPSGREWLHEIKYDGYRLHARLDRGKVQLLTRKGLDWTHKYPSTAAALAALNVNNAYIDCELCAVRPDGTTSFSGMQTASDSGGAGLVYFAFDILFVDGENIAELPLIERKARLEEMLTGAPPAIRYSDHVMGDGPRFRAAACEAKAEGVVSKRVDASYAPDNRGLWRRVRRERPCSRCAAEQRHELPPSDADRHAPSSRRVA